VTSFPIQPFIDAQKARGVHIMVLAICTLVMFIDGLDIFMVGKIAPAIARGMGSPPAAMTLVFVCQQAGLAIGAFVASPMADRFGRRRMLIIASVIFGVLTLAAAFTTTLLQLAILRGLSGIFLSSGLPIAVSLLAEVTPRHRRGTFIAIAFTGYSAGGAAGGAIAAWLIDIYGWQSGFWIGGLLPLISVPLMMIFLPESPQYLASRNGRDARIAPILRRIDRQVALTGEETFVVGDGSAKKGDAGLLDIFRDGRAAITTILWVACVLSMGSIALMAAWLPTFFQEMAGIPIQRFAILAMFGFFGGVVGTLAIGSLMDKIRPSRLIPFAYLCLAGTFVLLGVVPFEASGFIVVLLAMNLFQSGGQAGLNTLMTQIYPASMRSTGLGWAGGCGRIGGVLLPIFGGFAVRSDFSLQTTMTIVALAPLCVALLLMTMPTPGRTDAVRPAA